MTRHITDHAKAASNGRLIKTYVKAARSSGSAGAHEATLALQRRPQDRPKQNPRLREFLRIDGEVG